MKWRGEPTGEQAVSEVVVQSYLVNAYELNRAAMVIDWK